jgi:hypothetical protein
MADLKALVPNLVFPLHIVAPVERQEKVYAEIRRPVFQLLHPHPLAEICTFISYESITDLAANAHLNRLLPEVIDDYARRAERRPD